MKTHLDSRNYSIVPLGKEEEEEKNPKATRPKLTTGGKHPANARLANIHGDIHQREEISIHSRLLRQQKKEVE